MLLSPNTPRLHPADLPPSFLESLPVNHMSDRIDQIETSIHDLISTDLDHDHHQQQQRYPAVSASNSDVDDSRDNGQVGNVESPGGNGSRAGSEQSLLLAEPPLGVVEGSL